MQKCSKIMGLFPCKPFFSKSKDEGQAEKERRGRCRYGRTPDNDPFLTKYSFVHWKVCKEYLKCDIKPWKKAGRDATSAAIGLDSLQTEFFDQEYLRMKPLLFRMDGEVYRRVVGYREIMMKREHAEYLSELRRGCGGGKLKGYPVHHPYWKLARGGGGGGGGGGKKTVKKTKSPIKTKSPVKTNVKKDAKAEKKPPPKKPVNQKKKPGCFGLFAKKPKPSKKELMKLEKQQKTENILNQQVIKKWKWPNRRKRFPVPKSEPPGKYVVLLHRLYRLPKENEERDNEWLYLSSSTEENDPDVVTHFDHETHNSMTPGISFESQKLFRHLKLFWTLMTISGRSFLHHRNNFYRAQIEFSSQKRNMLIFFLTTILLWTVLCMSVCAYADINFQLNLQNNKDLKDPFLKVEKIELRKYWFPYSVIIGNLILVSFWSLAVILGDGPMIAHYLNCWCAALKEMETSGSVDIRKYTLRNLQIFLFLAASYTIMFVFNWPGQIRGSCMLTSMLLLRPSVPLMRINQPPKVLLYQWIGFGIQMYILFCARLVMCTLQVFALMVKNVSEMWNFKFSLRFKLLATENRGELFQLQLNHSLAKLWSHHRLVVLLLENYGIVFCVGIMCYLIPQACIFATSLAGLILSDDQGQTEAFYGDQPNIEIYSDYEPTIVIPYYHSRLESGFLALFIFVHICVDFLFTTETLVSATDAFMTGAEFVRRAGMMTAQKSHERRLIYSLQWSFSPTRLHALTANRYFTLDRHSLAKFFSLIILVFTIIIRLCTPSPLLKVTFPPPGSCDGTLGQTLSYGICSIRGAPRTTPIPPPAPAEYYFFTKHCEEIERKYINSSGLQSFEYYSENVSGIVMMADHPPFQICRVTMPDGVRLPSELENFGRYFQDHGSYRLKKTLGIYLSQTYDVTKIDYLKIRAATSALHPDSTGGTYCGPDARGQDGQLCDWVEYFRDCVVACYSNVLGKALLIPRMFKKVGSGVYTLYTDYSKVDCGLNPFGIRFQGDRWSTVEPAYDCFGNLVSLDSFDQCANIFWKEPVETFTPAVGDSNRLQRSYSSKWHYAAKIMDPVTLPTCDKCYHSSLGMERCSSAPLTKDHCSYARYWGAPAPKKGYYFADQCFHLNLDVFDAPKANGFCRWHYVEGGIETGHVVSEADYYNARTTHWDKEWNIGKGGDLPPCKQPSFALGSIRPIMEQLYYKHVCLSKQVPSPGSCVDIFPSPFYFYTYRPYELVDCTKLRQIKLDYETPQGNKQLCNHQDGTMKVPENVPFDLQVKGGTTVKYLLFYGCGGKPLLSTKTGKQYHCVSPEIGGVCEVDAAQGYLLQSDCTDPDVVASKSAVMGTIPQAHSWKLDYGICSALIDFGDPVFKDYRLKLVSEDLVFVLSKTTSWTVPDKWNTAIQILTAAPKAPTLPNSKRICDTQLTSGYCGSNSVALHYPYDGRDSVASNDKFLCNFETYIRDCLQPFQSGIYGDWVYLPMSADEKTLKLDQKQRKIDPLLNTFSISKDSVRCDKRKLPSGGTGLVDNYWKDECGWLMTPEFMDGDPKSLAVMPPILPFANKVYSDDGQQMVQKVVHCFESEYAIYRCTHPEISPVCNEALSNWIPAMEEIDFCYRFNMSCYQSFNKQPSGSTATPTYPEGFCRGYCPMADIKKTGTGEAIGETRMDLWRKLETFSFMYPPCRNGSGETNTLFLTQTAKIGETPHPREIERRLFFEFHCSDRSKNGVLRDYLGPTSGSFHWPLYLDEETLRYKYVPLDQLRAHLTSNYGESCDYGTNEGKIYPPFVTVKDSNGAPIKIESTDFLGCHGRPMVWFTELFLQNPSEMAYAGIKDPLKDYDKACYGRLLGGWCEAEVEPLVLLRDDFEPPSCDPTTSAAQQITCPSECTTMQGHFANHPLAKEIEDVPGYYPFVKTKKKFVRSVQGDTISSHLSKRTDLPYRRMFYSEFKETIAFWKIYFDPRQSLRSIHDYEHTMWGQCFKNDKVVTCAWPYYVRQCYIPCTLIWPKKVITEVSQSLVEQSPGQGNMYLRPQAYFLNLTGGFERPGSSRYWPAFSYMDCAIDPFLGHRNFTPNDYWNWVATCNGNPVKHLSDVDDFLWYPFPEYLPDLQNKVKDPVTGFEWIPWTLQAPKRQSVTFYDRSNFLDPTVANPPLTATTKSLYISPYLACPRIMQTPMRRAVITGQNSFWKYKPSTNLAYIPLNTYAYNPLTAWNDADGRKCWEAAVWVYIDAKACDWFKIQSPVLPIYGFCKAIFPAYAAHSSFAALVEPIQGSPPEGCFQNVTNPSVFQRIWTNGTHGERGFGLKYSMPDVYRMWNSLCHACAYTREMHQENVRQVWCGHQQDAEPACQSRLESKNEHRKAVVVGDGIFYKDWNWQKFVPKIGALWKLATEYACWDANKKGWDFFARWRVYHPWSLKHEKNSRQAAAYAIHVALNALNCPYPCRSEDESEDCNSKCPLELHNPCNRDLNDFFSYTSPTVGLNYTVILKENGNLCKIPLPGLNDNPQGLGVFGEYGTNIVRTENHWSRKGLKIYNASSEAVLLDDLRGQGAIGYRSHGIEYCRIYFADRCQSEAEIVPYRSQKLLYDAPRFTSVHPGWYGPGSDKAPKYSSYCAAFEGDGCQVTSVDWDYSKGVPGGYTSFAHWAAGLRTGRPFEKLKIVFTPECTANDQKLVTDLLNSEPFGSYSVPPPKGYCCIPFQKVRGTPSNQGGNWTEWELRFFLTARNTWTDCQDSVNSQTKLSEFGFLFQWNKFARYLSACPYNDCKSNGGKCVYKLRDYAPTADTNLCERQYDPKESFLTTPLPRCTLPLPPF